MDPEEETQENASQTQEAHVPPRKLRVSGGSSSVPAASGGASSEEKGGLDGMSSGGVANLGGFGGDLILPGGAPGTGGDSGTSNTCNAIDLGSAIGQVVSSRELVPQDCKRTTVPPPNYIWQAPYTGNWKFVALPCGSGWPTVTITRPVCEGEQIAFDDDSPIHPGNVAMAEVELEAGEQVSIHLGFLFWPESPHVASPTTVRIFEGERPQESNCSDGLDEDFDERTDCYDPDCRNAPECCGFYSDDCP